MGIKRIRNKKKPSETKSTKKKFTHRELCFDLAEAKGTNFIEVPLGSVWLNKKGLGIADVLTVKPSYNNFLLDVFECKVTRSDLMNDIKTEKYKKYLDHCNRFYYACVDGIVKKEDIPDECGLIVRKDNTWYTAKAAKVRNVDIPKHTLLSMIFYKGRIFSPKRNKISNLTNSDLDYKSYRDKLKVFGKKISFKMNKFNDLRYKYNELLNDVYYQIEDFEGKTQAKKYKEKWKYEEQE